jgi:transcriptional regulator with XRE-family HTH domain
MDDQRVGAAIRAVRIRRRWRQQDVAKAAAVSRASVSRLERGHLDETSLGVLRRVAAVLDVRVSVRPFWRAGDLDRLLNARHSALHEELARLFAELPGWIAQPEVSFSIYRERGVIDILAWHEHLGALLVIEIKTDIADVNELIGTLDRKRRLAARVARERGWHVRSLGIWLVIASGATNRRRVAAHRTVLGSLLPEDGRTMRAWLRRPVGTCRALSFWGPRSRPLYVGASRRPRRISNARPANVRSDFAARRRVRKAPQAPS